MDADQVLLSATLRVLCGPRPSPDAHLYVATNQPPAVANGPATWHQRRFASVNEAVVFLAGAADEAELYVATAWFVGNKRKKANVIAKRTICADIDDKSMPGARLHERHAQARKLAGSIPATTILIDSGGGFHPHLLLEEGQRLEDYDDLDDGRRHVEILTIALRLYLEGRGRELFGSPIELDPTDGAERMWRAPAGWNQKSADGAKTLTADTTLWRAVSLARPAKAAALASVAPANLEFLVPYMRAAEELWDKREARKPTPVATVAATEPKKQGSSGAGVAVATQDAAHFTPSLLSQGLSAKWPMDDGGDQSKHDIVLACDLARQGWAPDVARVGIMLRRSLLAHPADQAKGERADYLSRTCQAAYGRAGPSMKQGGVPQPSPFPVEAFPKAVARYLRAAALALSCAIEALVLPLLASIGAAIGNSRRIRIKSTWQEPPLIWALVVMPSGTLKTPAQNTVLGPYRRRQTDRFDEYREALRKHRADEKKHKVELRAWERDMRDDPSRESWKGDPPEAPAKPTLLRSLVSDITVEALALVLSENPRGVLLERDELGGWFESFGTYKGGRGGDLQSWLSIHSAGPILVDRKGNRETIHVESAYAGICGGIQPDALRRALTPAFLECGLLARFLVAMPSPPPKQWSEASLPARLEKLVRRLFGRLFELRGTASANGRSRPVDLPFSVEARPIWVDRYNAFAKRQSRCAYDPAVGPALSKLEGYTARFALIIEHMSWGCEDDAGKPPTSVSAESLRSAIRLTDWFADEAIRVYARLRESAQDQQAREFAGWVQGRGGRATARDVQRSGPSRLRGSSEVAHGALAELVASGWGYWWLRPPPSTGGSPTRGFVLRGDGDTRSEEALFVAGLEERVSPHDPGNAGETATETPDRRASPPGEEEAP